MTRLLANPWLTLGVSLVFVVALGGTCYSVGRKHEANAQAAALLKETQRAQIAESRLRQKVLEIDAHDNIEREALDQRLIVNLSRPQPIRLCEPAASSEPAASVAAAQLDGAGAGRHVLQAGPDLGPALHVYGRDCERLRQKLTTLQAWARLVAPAQPSEASQ